MKPRDSFRPGMLVRRRRKKTIWRVVNTQHQVFAVVEAVGKRGGVTRDYIKYSDLEEVRPSDDKTPDNGRLAL